MVYNNKELVRFVKKMNDKYFSGKTIVKNCRWSTRMTTCFGTASYTKKELSFSTTICGLNNFTYDSPEFEEVVVHELCHLYLYQTQNKFRGHGPLFQKEMLRCFPNGSVQGGKDKNKFTYHYHTVKRNKFVGEWVYPCGCHPNARAKRGPSWIKQGETDIDTRYRCRTCSAYVMFHRYIKK